MKHYFVTNPAAGKKNSCETLRASIETTCQERGVDFEIYETTCVGDAERYVRKVCENDRESKRIYACGGDGTFSEVVSGAAGYENVSLGLIPAGSGNDFVRNFTKKELFFDISAQIDGEGVSIDLLKCNHKYAINMVNIGFDCEVVKKMMRIKRSPLVPAGLAYIFGLVITLIKKPGVKTEVSVDGGEYEPMNLLLTTMANGCYCGGGFHSNPYALLTDGNINALFIKNISRIKFISLVSSYKSGTHICEKNADILTERVCKKLSFRFPTTQSISVDGEVNDIEKQLDFEVFPKAIRFIIPKGSEFLKADAKPKEEALV